MLVDRGCYERGCACFDARIDKDPVLVPNAEWQGLTAAELDEIRLTLPMPFGDVHAAYHAIETKLKEKNTCLKG